MDHPSGKIGEVFTRDPYRLARPYDRSLNKGPVSCFPEICLSDEAQKVNRILEGRIRPFAIEGRIPGGIRALRELRTALRAHKRDEDSDLKVRLSARKNGEPPNIDNMAATSESINRLALRVGLGIGDIAKAYVRKLAKQPTVKSDHVDLIGYFEQTPNPDSRIVLGNERDDLGLRKVCVDWRLTALDRHTYRTAANLFGNELARTVKGRFQIEPWLEEDDSAVPQVCGTAHHLGTTRMSDDPNQGVVDRECRVHGFNNLHVAGSSIFPTGGWAFPTFTIIALSLRLAEHLRTRLEFDSLVSLSPLEAVGEHKKNKSLLC
jgi:choline dehydrogenase-like flavoprotein